MMSKTTVERKRYFLVIVEKDMEPFGLGLEDEKGKIVLLPMKRSAVKYVLERLKK